MEYIESQAGVYPSTEGFLVLLQSLFRTAGSPADLGRNWRARTGCTPYLEFAINLVLPRVTGLLFSSKSLPFKSDQDRYRLLSAALEVAESAMAPYVVVAKGLSGVAAGKENASDPAAQAVAAAIQKLGDSSFARSLVQKPSSKDVVLFAEELGAQKVELSRTQDASNTVVSGTIDQTSLLPVSNTLAPIPRAMSPGFTGLISILSSSGASLLNAVISILAEKSDGDTVGDEADRVSLSFSLYKSIPPTFESAKNVSKGKLSLVSQERLLKTFLPDFDPYCYTSAASWRSKATLSALRLLCLAIAREEALHSAIESLPSFNSFVPTLRFEKSITSSRLKVYDLQLARASQLLLTANSRTGVISSLVNMVAYSSLTSKLDLEISTAAVALIFYIEKTLDRRASIADAYQHVQDGQSRVAQAFGSRMQLSLRRSFSEKDKELALLILGRILGSLRQNDISAGSLASIILGFSSYGQEGSWVQPASSSDCFDALIQALDDTTLTLWTDSPDLVANSYEILYRLYAMSGDMWSIASGVAERLRCQEFLQTHLLNALDHSRKLDIVSSKGEAVHSVAWLLKCAAHEMHHLAGLVGGSAPQPDHLGKIVSFLLSPPSFVLFSCITIMPIERDPFQTVQSLPPEETVRCAKTALTGAPEVVQGFEVIDLNRLIQGAKVQDNLDDITVWCDQWNRSVVKDCASAHISRAIHILMGSFALVSKHTMHLDLSFDLAGYMPLRALLGRFGEDTARSHLQPMDALFFAAATRNLSMAALEASECVASRASRTQPAESDNDAAVSLALTARAISASAQIFRPSDVDSNFRDERTAILACTFLHLLRKTLDLEALHTDGFYAAVALARLSSRPPSSIHYISDSPAQISRSCLAFLLDLMQNDAPTTQLTFAQRLLAENLNEFDTTTIAEAAINLIAELDVNICELLLNICMLPGCGRMIIEAKVYDALMTAANRYTEEEHKVLTTLDTTFSQQDFAVPEFLHGHLRLLNMMLSVPVPEEQQANMAVQSLQIIGRYESLLRRILARFPVDGDLLHTVYLIMSQVTIIMRSSRAAFRERSVNSGPRPIDLEKSMIVLALHLAENPLPRGMLPSLPAQFETGQSHTASMMVRLSAVDDKIWWDRLDLNNAQASGTSWQPTISSEVLSYANAATEIVISGLSLLREEQNFEVAGILAISRGLCRCVDAVKVSDMAWIIELLGMSSLTCSIVTDA